MADYSAYPELAVELARESALGEAISGAEAYERYVAHTLPFLKESGGEVLLDATGGPWLIGPEGERWDRALLIRQKSVEAFLASAGHEGYLAGLGHRAAALEDSRLLPLCEVG